MVLWETERAGAGVAGEIPGKDVMDELKGHKEKEIALAKKTTKPCPACRVGEAEVYSGPCCRDTWLVLDADAPAATTVSCAYGRGRNPPCPVERYCCEAAAPGLGVGAKEALIRGSCWLVF